MAAKHARRSLNGNTLVRVTCYSVILLLLTGFSASLTIQPAAAQSNSVTISAGTSQTLSLETCPQIISGEPGTGMDVQATASGDVADWVSPGSIDFGYVAYGDCSTQSYTLTAPVDAPAGDYSLVWTYTCQLVGAEGTCNDYVLTIDVTVEGPTTTAPTATTTTVECAPNPVDVDTTTTCTATVTGNSPTGDVSFSSDSSTGSFSQDSCSLDSSSSCSVDFSDSQAGTVSITATYGGDSSNDGSAGSYDLTVLAHLATTTTTVTCSDATIGVDSSTTCTVMVVGNSATGEVTFSSDSSTGSFDQDTCTLVGQAAPSCWVHFSDSQPGTVVITANYAGDQNNDPSSGSFTLVVSSHPETATSTAVNCSPSPTSNDSVTTCTATVAFQGAGATGAVTFSTSSQTGRFTPSDGQCVLSSETCSVDYSDSQPGTVTITASYGGDSNNDPSSGSFALTISQVTTSLVPSSTTIGCVPNPVGANSSANCAVTVLGDYPGGTVSFSTDSATGSFPSGAECTLSNGDCSVEYSDSHSGTVTITATYDGDAKNDGSSASFTLTVVTAQTTCPTVILSEGLAPAAPTTGEDNIYITLTWGGQIPVGGLRARFGAVSHEATMGAAFAFNPATMMTSRLSVLMDVTTQDTPDGTYVVTVSATVTDPTTGQPCPAPPVDVDVTVSGTTVFVTTQGNQPAQAVWPKELNSAILFTVDVSSTQLSDFAPTLDSSNHMTGLTFTITGTQGTDGTTTLTIPKADVSPGYVPVVTIDGQPVPANEQSYTQDATNFYVTFTTHFSSHVVQLLFQSSSPATTSNSGPTTSNGGTTINPSPPSPNDWVYTALGLLIVLGVPLLILALAYSRLRGRKQSPTLRERQGKEPTTPAPIRQVRYCPRCGAAVSGDLFCTNCGAKIAH